MQWSQLKRRFEATFADRVKGRVEVFATRYRRAHDDAGECWATIDGARVACMAEISYFKAFLGTAQRLREERDCLDYQDPAQRKDYYDAYDEAARLTRAAGVHSDAAFKKSLFAYLSLSIDDILASDDPIIRAFAMLDKRFGKRRLEAFDPSGESALLRRLHAFRCEVEGVGALVE